jgi:segregation and condensation protein A
VNPTIHVKTEVFEGPLEVLLVLIEKRKLLINEIALAQVADDFIDYTRTHERFPLGEAAQFVLIASTLLLIKSRSLLPQLELTEDEQASVEDLELRLKLYQIFRGAGKVIRAQFGTRMLYQQAKRRVPDPIFTPDARTSVAELRSAIDRVIHNLPKPQEPKHEAIVRQAVSLEEMIDRLTKRVQSALHTSFHQFSGHASGASRVDVVVSFLAMLELVKQGIVRVEQEARYADILIETDTIGTPHYG